MPAAGPVWGYVSADAAMVGWVAHWRDDHDHDPDVSGVVDHLVGAGPVTVSVGAALALLAPPFDQL